MVQVSDVLADKGLAVHNQRDGIFEVGAQRENGALGRKCCNCARSVTAGPAQDHRTERASSCYGVVHSARDGPLPNQKRVRYSCETLQCVFVLVRDRLT